MIATAQQIRDRISEICTMFSFLYHEKRGGVDPFNKHSFGMFFGEQDKTMHSIDEVMNTPFFDGQSLSEIVGEIEIIEW